MRSVRLLGFALAIAALGLRPAPSGAQTLDQSQEVIGGGVLIASIVTAWQTFTPSITGRLTDVELQMSHGCPVSPCAPGSDLTVEIVTTAGGVPTANVLASATIAPGAASQSYTWVAASFTASPLYLTAGTTYAIHLANGSPAGASNDSWGWAVADADLYAGGAEFIDSANADGLDDPAPGFTPDGTFRTYMAVPACGDGVQDPGEECDDGNTADGDSCSATCAFVECGDGVAEDGEACDDGNTVAGDGCSTICEVEFCGDTVLNDVDETCDDGNTVSGDGCSAACQEEFCGDGVVASPTETCDDANTVSDDGCTAECAVEPSALACQAAIAKGAQKFVASSLAALQKCRLALAEGKALSVTEPAQCAQETTAAKSIAKAAAQMRKAIAGKKPKCTDALVAALGTCADTVDGLLSADAASGCLRAEQDAAVLELLETQFGY